MKKIYLTAIVAVFFLTGCEEDALKDALLADNLKMSEGAYNSDCVNDGNSGSFFLQFTVSESGFESEAETSYYSGPDCQQGELVDTVAEGQRDIGYGYLEIQSGVSYISASTLYGSEAAENEAVAYSIDQETGVIYLSEAVVLQDQSEASEAFALFLQDPASNAYITLSIGF